MSVKDAVATRLRAICAQQGIRINELANISGVTPSTVYSLLDPRCRDVSVITVKKLCDGLNMTLAEFFTAPVFDEGNRRYNSEKEVCQILAPLVY